MNKQTTKSWLALLNKYSISPSHKVTVRPSRHRRYFILVIGLAAGTANLLVILKGYPFTGSILTLGTIAVLWWSMPDPMAGAVLKWESGEWFLLHAGKSTSVLLLPGSVRTHWLIYAAFAESHASRRWAFLLFSDSASGEELRRLRCRLALTK